MIDYARLAIAITIAVLTAACAFLAHGWHAESQAFAEFRGGVEALGKAQEERTRDRIAQDKARKESSDASYSTALTVLGRDLERLHQPGPGPRDLSAAPADSRCPPTLRCLDRGEFDTALRSYQEREEGFEGRTAALIGEGATVKLRLDTAIHWANP